MKAFQAGMEGELRKDPDTAAVYARNPGLLDAIAEAGRPIVRKHFAAVVPMQQRRYAEFYAAKFSTEEIDQLIFFYSSPTGTKVIAAMYAGANLGQLFEKAVARKDGNLTAKDVSELNSSATEQLPEKFDAEDWKAMFVFTSTPAYAKLLKVAPEFNQLVADVQNEPDPAMDTELDKAVEAAVGAYMAKRKGKPST